MKLINTTYLYIACLLILGVSISACDSFQHEHDHEPASVHGHGEAVEHEVEKGEHGGRMLRDDVFALELSIFETGVPPEFRVWATQDGKPLKPEDVDLQINLTRLGDKVDHIGFKPQGDVVQNIFLDGHLTGLLQGNPPGPPCLQVRNRDEYLRADPLEVDRLVYDHLVSQVHPPGGHQAGEHAERFLPGHGPGDETEIPVADNDAPANEPVRFRQVIVQGVELPDTELVP